VAGRRFAVALLLGGVLAGCAVPPAGPRSSSATAPRRSVPRDDAMAQEAALLQSRGQSRMREQKQRLERVGKRLLETIPSHPNVQFVIINGDPSINAGATFGQVAVTSGMLDFIQSDDEMAVILGHELAHITEGHVVKGAISGLALNVLAIVLESRVPGAGQAAGGVGQLFLNHYTQTQEREADDVGLRYAYQAGYDPRAGVDVQERLAVQVPQSMSAGYFDTHPSSVERAVSARHEADELLSRGDPPGRSEVLALERADEGAARGSRARAKATSSQASSGATTDSTPARAVAVDSDDCRRAAVYAEMARDAQDPEERQELQRRATRYCPSLSGAANATHQEPVADAPLDRY
jgi:predicted Zn-dependent protease